MVMTSLYKQQSAKATYLGWNNKVKKKEMGSEGVVVNFLKRCEPSRLRGAQGTARPPPWPIHQARGAILPMMAVNCSSGATASPSGSWTFVNPSPSSSIMQEHHQQVSTYYIYMLVFLYPAFHR
jgi:hypothetical protein